VGNAREAEQGSGEEHSLGAVAGPDDDGEQHGEGSEGIDSESKSLSAEPGKIGGGFLAVDGVGAAENRRSVEAALDPVFVGAKGELVDANGKDAVVERSQMEGLRASGVRPFRIGWEFAVGGEETAVPVDGVNVGDVGDEERPVGRDAVGRGNAEVFAIPGIADIGAVALRAPGCIGGELFPAVLAGSVVDGRCGEGRIVADVELPWAVEGNGVFTESADRECGGECGSSGLRECGGGASEGQEKRATEATGQRISPGGWRLIYVETGRIANGRVFRTDLHVKSDCGHSVPRTGHRQRSSSHGAVGRVVTGIANTGDPSAHDKPDRQVAVFRTHRRSPCQRRGICRG
jgi:hypothetical protein